MPTSDFFGTPEELFRHIKSKVDDINCIYINFSNCLVISNGMQTRTITGAGGLIDYCNGTPAFIHSTDLERLLNDEGIRRLNIPFKIILPDDPVPKFGDSGKSSNPDHP